MITKTKKKSIKISTSKNKVDSFDKQGTQQQKHAR